MKTQFCIPLIILLMFVALNGYSQAPHMFNYQAVVRNDAGSIIANSPVGVLITIREGSAPGVDLYQEQHNVVTNQFGLISLEIGNGTPIYETFDEIDWSSGAKYLYIKIDIGNGFVTIGAPQLLSVPYALYSNIAGSLGTSGQTGPTGPQGVQGITGPQGVQGIQGPTGADGAQGPQGIQGPAGLLTPGSFGGNTPYWDGNTWITNSSNLFNNGSSIGIGTTLPDPSAQLDVTSTSKVFLPPRMSQSQRDAITNPANAGIIFNTCTNELQIYRTPASQYIDGSGQTSTMALWEGPYSGQIIQPLHSGVLSSIEGQFAIRSSAGDIVAKIYDGVNGNLLATSDNTVNDADATEFTFVSGSWTFNNSNMILEAFNTYYIEFSATNGNHFFFGSSVSYPRGILYTGTAANMTPHPPFNLDLIVNYGGCTGGWTNVIGTAGPQGLQGIPGPQGPQGSCPNGNALGDMQIWDGSHWVMLSAGIDGQILKIVNGMPAWVNP
jgi:hypothetical protein